MPHAQLLAVRAHDWPLSPAGLGPTVPTHAALRACAKPPPSRAWPGSTARLRSSDRLTTGIPWGPPSSALCPRPAEVQTRPPGAQPWESGGSLCPRSGAAGSEPLLPAGPRSSLILQPPMELGRPAGAQKDPREAQGPDRTLDVCSLPGGIQPQSTSQLLEEDQDSLQKHFLSEENMVSHFSHLSLENDYPYCGPSVAFSTGTPAPLVTRPHSTEDLGVLFPSLLLALNPHSELLLWQYPGNQIPETLRLLRLGGSQVYQNPHSGEAMEL
ncbi:host cell factor C1 regulator 1 isoform X1 [Notamacropus eugenii]|uniref:host cell factor C1 regulator 1 isoform X1 n=1 Tax=Notamacropus eugenii TaxID=9315 RepID=UPI003B670B54